MPRHLAPVSARGSVCSSLGPIILVKLADLRAEPGLEDATDVQPNLAPKVHLAASVGEQNFAPRASPPSILNRRRERQFSEFNAKQFQRAKQLAKRPGREGIEGRHCGNEPLPAYQQRPIIVVMFVFGPF